MIGGDVLGAVPFAGDAGNLQVPATRLSMSFPSFVHPRLHQDLEPLWPSRCTIQVLTEGFAESGQPIGAEGVDVSGLQALSCRLGPVSDYLTDNERRSAPMIESYSRRTLKLNGYYPTIVERQMWAVVDGAPYAIRGVEHDSEKFCTRLTVEALSPQRPAL